MLSHCYYHIRSASFFLVIIFILASCTKPTDSAETADAKVDAIGIKTGCAKLGEAVIRVAGSSPHLGLTTQQCCDDLKTVSHPLDALNGAAPGRIICAACGDAQCDVKYENNSNCPQDCK